MNSALTGQLGCKQQPMKATAVRLARVQDPTGSTLGLSMPGLSALLAGKTNICRLKKMHKISSKKIYCKLFYAFFHIFKSDDFLLF